jgi:pimeloyl-ACP methyl ester carboxylesterase
VDIQPFRIEIAESDIDDLRRRLEHTRWPSAITGAGWTQGMDAAFLRSVAEYWHARYDWRAVEAALNAYSHYRTETPRGHVHFVRLRGEAAGARAIVLTHGWPSTFAELLPLADRLAHPAAHGAAGAESFDVVVPSLPGYGFSSAPTSFGTNMLAIADDWAALMRSLGYARFIAQGGDIGAGVSTALALRHPDRLAGLHLNFIPGSFRPQVPEPPDYSTEEQAFLAGRAGWLELEGGYSHLQSTKPDVLAPALNDSPMGLAAWIIEKFRAWSDSDGEVLSRFTMDELLTTVSIYWFTASMPSAMRLYWEGRQAPLRFAPGERIRVPVGIAHFPREVWMPPRRYVERGYNVTRWTEMPAGGHFAPLEEPDGLAAEIRAFAASPEVVTR